MAIEFGKYSLYKRTPQDGNFRGYYEHVTIPKDSRTDYTITVQKKYHQHPGVLANDLYGEKKLFWVFMYFNRDTIFDPIFDLKENMVITVPVRERLLSSLG